MGYAPLQSRGSLNSHPGRRVLKSQYGGASLGSRITYVPIGYRGLALDGVAPLIANAGQQNLALSPTATTGPAGDGLFAPLLTPNQSYNASLTVKRDFAKWLTIYAEGGWSRYESRNLVNPAAGNYTLDAAAADNPFTRSIIVSVPIASGNQWIKNASTNWRLLTGAIVKLPFDWQAAIDLTWNWNSYAPGESLASFDLVTANAVGNGSINLLRDLMGTPPTFTYLDKPQSGLIGQGHGSSRSYTLKLAGPLPLIRLPGGKPIATFLLEQGKQTQGQYVNFQNTVSMSSVSYTPPRSQRTDSAYGEIRFPLIGERNKIPLIRELEIQTAVRYDRYVGIGANANLTCFPNQPAPLPESAYTAPCPQVGAAPAFATTRNSSTNPTIAIKWGVDKNLTFRGSYSTGYRPPQLNSVISFDAGGAAGSLLAGKTIVNVTDPLRGNERVGQSLLGLFQILPARLGGNPNVDPETSRSWSAGAILTPTFVPGLRISIDWTLIQQKNLYFQPQALISNGNLPGGQQAFNDFLAAHPERFPRDTNPATFGAYTVGPIIFADVTTANLSHARSEALDFTLSYDRQIGKGQLNVQASATRLLDLTIQTTASAAPLNATGVIDNNFLSLLGAVGGVDWKGNGSISYSTDRWTLGARGRYIGSYWLNVQHAIQPLQGSAKIPAQAYFDLFGSFKINDKTQLRAGLNNVFDKSPPINSKTSLFYSFYGDPRRANFYLSISRRF
ncbi:MAG: TonB-dependent receptor [Sphingomonas sp.]|uniref:TonB-dependent receptor domain-containing protein n=1 Tax=Sphingomonas sp. TaxID=28214 RepID=UPI0035693115